MNTRFEPLEHTADKGIKAYGCSLDELFENAAFGMFSLMADLDKYTPVVSREISVESTDTEELLRTWLAELLYQFEVDRILFTEFEIKKIKNNRAEGIAKGLPFNPDIEWLGSGIKAVTHHDLSVRRTDDRWEAAVIFDV